MLFHHQNDFYGMPSETRRIVCCEVEEDVFFAGVMEQRFGQQMPRVLIKGPPAAEVEGALEGLMEMVCQRMADKLEECEEYERKLIEKPDPSSHTRDMSKPAAYSCKKTTNGLEPLHLAPDHFPLAPWSAVQVGTMPDSDKTNRDLRALMRSKDDWCLGTRCPYGSTQKYPGPNDPENERQVPEPVHSRFSSNSSNGVGDFPPENALEESKKANVASVSGQEGKMSDAGRVKGQMGKEHDQPQTESKSTTSTIPAHGTGKTSQSASASMPATSSPVRKMQDAAPRSASRPSLDPIRKAMEFNLREEDYSALFPYNLPPKMPLQPTPSKPSNSQPSQELQLGPDGHPLNPRESVVEGRQPWPTSHRLSNKSSSLEEALKLAAPVYPTTQTSTRLPPVIRSTADLPPAPYRAVPKGVAQSKTRGEKETEDRTPEAFPEHILQAQKRALEALRSREMTAAKAGKSKDDAVLQGSGMSMTDQMIAGAKARLEAHKLESDRRTGSDSSAADKSDESRRGSWTTMDSDSERSA
ncbi:hypothetical protein EV356DRAFT_272250 [Viridothelium virens]|uniref:Uncharacterized protein n=1 Tax=Viridothelium virens TaxID=1048519 RepID=A0A6A6H1P2_VIRVR|nr:hypothetical protein EV356DRAFT_272250 [Viridothelium virens]